MKENWQLIYDVAFKQISPETQLVSLRQGLNLCVSSLDTECHPRSRQLVERNGMSVVPETTSARFGKTEPGGFMSLSCVFNDKAYYWRLRIV